MVSLPYDRDVICIELSSFVHGYGPSIYHLVLVVNYGSVYPMMCDLKRIKPLIFLTICT